MEGRARFISRKLAFIVLAVSTCLTMMGATMTVRAASVTTTVFSDPPPGACATSGTGNCSLREAIIYANAHPGTTIALGTGTYLLTIGATGDDDVTSGDINITALGTTTIAGAGPDRTIIDATGFPANGTDRVFAVGKGATVVLSGMTIRGGNAGSGGGINNGGTLTVSNVILSGNYAKFNGGAIYNNGMLQVVNSTITGNTTPNGSASVFNEGGSIMLTNTRVGSNSTGMGDTDLYDQIITVLYGKTP